MALFFALIGTRTKPLFQCEETASSNDISAEKSLVGQSAFRYPTPVGSLLAFLPPIKVVPMVQRLCQDTAAATMLFDLQHSRVP